MPTMLDVLIALMACTVEPPPPPPAQPTIAVVVPLTGANAPIGESAWQGAMLAADDVYKIQPIDENAGDPVTAAQAIPNLVGVVGHVSEAAADRWGHRWVEGGIPMISATSSMLASPPHILPDITQLAQCSTAFVDPRMKRLSLLNDGTANGMAAAGTIDSTLHTKLVQNAVLDATQLAREAERIRAARSELLLYAGDPELAGNLVRTMRLSAIRTRIAGIGLYDPRFIAVAGGAVNGSLVTTGDRPGLDAAVVDSFQKRFGQPPAAPALNAYDATRILREAYEVAVRTNAPDKAQATRDNLARVQVAGAAGQVQIINGTAMPVWCTEFYVESDQFQWKALASLKADGTVALDESMGVVVDPNDAKLPTTTTRRKKQGDAVILR